MRQQIEEEMQILIQLQPEIELLQEKKRKFDEVENLNKKKYQESTERQRSQKTKNEHAEKLRQLSRQQKEEYF